MNVSLPSLIGSIVWVSVSFQKKIPQTHGTVRVRSAG